MKWTALAPQGWDTQQLGAGSCFGCEVILVGWLFYCSILIFSCFSFSHSSCFCKPLEGQPHGSSVSSPQPSLRFLPSKRCSTTCYQKVQFQTSQERGLWQQLPLQDRWSVCPLGLGEKQGAKKSLQNMDFSSSKSQQLRAALFLPRLQESSLCQAQMLSSSRSQFPQKYRGRAEAVSVSCATDNNLWPLFLKKKRKRKVACIWILIVTKWLYISPKKGNTQQATCRHFLGSSLSCFGSKHSPEPSHLHDVWPVGRICPMRRPWLYCWRLNCC